MKRLGGKITDLITPALVRRITDRYISEHRGRRAVRRIERDRAGFALALYKEMISGDYTPGRFRRKHIGGNGVKERDILVPTVRDAVAASVLVEVFCAFTGRRLYPHTFCNRRGYGSALCAKKLHAHIMRDRPTYYVKADIRKCFDSVLHSDVVAYIRRTIKNRPLADMILRLALPPEVGSVGIPIGNGLSHHVANGILSPVWFAARRLPGVMGLFAYMDDIVLTGNNRRKLARAVDTLRGLLAEHGFRFKYDPAPNRTTEGVDMVGFRFWPDGRRRLRRRNYRHAVRAARGSNPRRAAAYIGMAKIARDAPLLAALRRKVNEGKRNGTIQHNRH